MSQIENAYISVLKHKETKLVQFNNLLTYNDVLVHAFSTRIGGVSENEYSSLNLGIKKFDKKENILENYRRVALALGIDCENMVLSSQVHEDKIYIADEKDRGKGIIREGAIHGFDCLMTDKKDVVLVTFYADCVPILFFDPEKKVIASAHSGWRGTVLEIAAKTVMKMNEVYGSKAENIKVTIGPSIGKCCFLVGHEVYEEFNLKLDFSKNYCEKAHLDKWYINLQGIIKRSLQNSGVLEENILDSSICTVCNKQEFFSYRGDVGKTGSLAAFMMIK